jgi:hypothetical protein
LLLPVTTVKPDIVSNSEDVVVVEGQNVSLSCEAVGYPKPTIQWKREDGKNITIRKLSSANDPASNPNLVVRQDSGDPASDNVKGTKWLKGTKWTA